MHRVVLDTNVLAPAFACPGSVCDQLFQKLVSAQVELVVSSFILSELRRVLARKFGVVPEAVDETIELLRNFAIVVEPSEQLKTIANPDADNRILECAIAGDVEYLVTGDTKHLLPLGHVRGIPLITPRQALDQLT